MFIIKHKGCLFPNWNKKQQLLFFSRELKKEYLTYAIEVQPSPLRTAYTTQWLRQ